ncbi:MAG TPA: 2,4-dihydroxyhept-2-ene-1,7-dioic acid aldolase, partial [Chloroflexota bacterium]
ERRVIETALKMGVPPRAEIFRPEDARRYLDMGVKHFCIGTDMSILWSWLKENGRAMRELLGAGRGG